MSKAFESAFAALSAQCRRHIRDGHLTLYSADLKKMAKLLESEGRFSDELKLLITAFELDLSGLARAPYIDDSLIEMLLRALSGSGMDVGALHKLYFSLIQPDMAVKHTLSADESWYLFRLCTEGKIEQAQYILTQI